MGLDSARLFVLIFMILSAVGVTVFINGFKSLLSLVQFSGFPVILKFLFLAILKHISISASASWFLTKPDKPDFSRRSCHMVPDKPDKPDKPDFPMCFGFMVPDKADELDKPDFPKLLGPIVLGKPNKLDFPMLFGSMVSDKPNNPDKLDFPKLFGSMVSDKPDKPDTRDFQKVFWLHGF